MISIILCIFEHLDEKNIPFSGLQLPMTSLHFRTMINFKVQQPSLRFQKCYYELYSLYKDSAKLKKGEIKD